MCIFDWDIHAGDGSAALVYDDPNILYISIHRHDDGRFYPGEAGSYERVGEGAGKGFNIMYPFNATSGDERIVGDAEYIYACKQVLFPVIQEFDPDMILISAGFDSALGDPLG